MDSKGHLGFEGRLHVRVVKHGPIKRVLNKVRPRRNVDHRPVEIDLRKSMRG